MLRAEGDDGAVLEAGAFAEGRGSCCDLLVNGVRGVDGGRLHVPADASVARKAPIRSRSKCIRAMMLRGWAMS